MTAGCAAKCAAERIPDGPATAAQRAPCGLSEVGTFLPTISEQSHLSLDGHCAAQEVDVRYREAEHLALAQSEARGQHRHDSVGLVESIPDS